MGPAARAMHERHLEGMKRALARAEAKRDAKGIAEAKRLIAEIEAILA